MKQFSLIAILILPLLLSGFQPAFGQKATLHFRYMPDAVRKHELRRTTVSVSLHKFNGRDGTGDGYGSVDLDDGVNEVSFYNLPSDSLILTIHGRSLNENNEEIRFEIVGHRLAFKKNAVNRLEILYPPDCKYYNNRKNKTCSICKKTDKVLPIVYGFVVLDPLEKRDKNSPLSGPYYPGDCSPTGCDPNWYCERDKHKF
jgi:hypothetical protein